MNAKSISNPDLGKDLLKFQLPNRFKKIGLALAVLSFSALFLNAFTINDLIYRGVARYGMLLGLLVISISKEEIEDERIRSLRMQSYSFAFIVGVIYAFAIPLLDFGVDSVFNADNAGMKGLGDFMILWILLTIQVFYFESLKRKSQ